MADKSPEDWRAGGPRRPEKKYGWKPPEDKGAIASKKRPAMMLALAAGGVAVLGGLIYLIWLLIVPARPGLITIAANPAAAAVDRLDVPYDPYGWLSAESLVRWGKAANASDNRSPKVLADEPEWLDQGDDSWEWIDKLRKDTKIDPVVIYVGLHGGVSAEGKPFLYTGRTDATGAPATVRVGEIVKKLGADEAIRKKRKVLVLDVSRGVPDPNLGEVHHDFVRAAREDADLQDQIRQTPQFVVICAAGAGQRAWESADLGMTTLAYHLMKGLAGEAAQKDRSAFTAADLFEYVKRETNTWAKNNRPTGQEPILFPDRSTDDRAVSDYGKRTFFTFKGGVSKPDDVLRPGPAAVPGEVRERWNACAKLAAGYPSPAAYTPLGWRRFRELMLRYEQAAMAGEADGQKKLGAALDRTADQIEHGLKLGLTSTGWLLPLPAAAAAPEPAADGLPAALKGMAAAGGAESLRSSVDRIRSAATARQPRPLEAHELLVTEHFFADAAVKEEPPADLWRWALRTSLLAGRATLGSRDDGRPTYSEQVWPFLRPSLLKLDEARRAGDDALFAGAGGRQDHHKQARDKFDEAEKGYTATLEAVHEIQDGMRARDELYAELPFLGRWLSEADADTAGKFPVKSDHAAACALWGKAHELSDRLDALAGKSAPPTREERESLAAMTGEVRSGLSQLRTRFKEQVVVGLAVVSNQTQLQAVLPLLQVPVPLVAADGTVLFTADDRVRLVETMRRIEQEFLQVNTPLADLGSDPGDKVKRRAAFALNALGDSVWKSKVAQGRPQLAVINVAVNKVLADPEKVSATAEVADVLAQTWKYLAESAEEAPGKVEDWRKAERYGRLAVPFAEVKAADTQQPFEPVAQIRRARWRTLLEGLAARVAADHWYDEDGKEATFAKAAKAMLTDARGLASSAKPADDAAVAQRLIDVMPLRLAAELVGGQPVGTGDNEAVRWTTEPVREFKVELTGGGSPLKGSAVRWARSNAPDVLRLSETGRSLLALPEAASAGPAVSPMRIEAGEVVTKSLAGDPRKVVIAAHAFFRGQRLDSPDLRVTVNPRPDLVVSEARPDSGAMIAVRADDDLEPGRISIVLDYSGSMEEDTNGKPVGFRDPRSKLALALATLREVLDSLPKTTKVSIRVFAHDPEAGQAKNWKAWLKAHGRGPGQEPFSQKVFPRADLREQPEEFRLRRDEVFERLGKLYPTYSTPLVDSVREAIDDKEFLRDDGSPQTLLVLTDGANTVLDGEEAPLKGMNYNVDDAGWKKKVADAVAGLKRSMKANLALHMIFFSAGDEEHAALEMFAPIERASAGGPRESAGRLWKARDKEELKKHLERVLRPKPRLLDPNDQLVDALGQWRAGMPANRASDKPDQLWWYGPRLIPTRTTGTYSLEFARSAERLRLRDGDRMVVRMSGTPDRVTFRREVYYKDVDPAPAAGKRTRELGGWHAAVPGYRYDRSQGQFVVVDAALERVAAAGPGGVISHGRPGFLWWELDPASGGKEQFPPGTVFVRNVRTHRQPPAPCWRVIAADDERDPKLERLTETLRVWAADPPETLGGRPIEVKAPAQLAAAAQTVRPPSLPGVTLQVSLEDIPFLPDPSVDEGFQRFGNTPRRCLVVRVSDRQGRLLQVRLPELDLLEHKEHRYFYVKDGNPPVPSVPPFVAGYTGVFGPIEGDTPFAGLDRLTVELVSVSDVLKDKDRAIEIPLGVPRIDGPRPDIRDEGGRGTVEDAGLR
jgi:hypothetical protein